MDPPLVTNIQARSVTLTWELPVNSNGVINQYRIYVNGQLRTTVSMVAMVLGCHYNTVVPPPYPKV